MKTSSYQMGMDAYPFEQKATRFLTHTHMNLNNNLGLNQPICNQFIGICRGYDRTSNRIYLIGCVGRRKMEHVNLIPNHGKFNWEHDDEVFRFFGAPYFQANTYEVHTYVDDSKRIVEFVFWNDHS